MESLIDLGYIGLFIGSFLASTLIPLSADFLLVGMISLQADIWFCLLLATAGNWLGGMTSYWLGWMGSWKWLEKWMHVKEERLASQKHRIDRYGSALAFFAWLPLIGDLFAVALGFYKISPRKCALFMLVGRAARFSLWILLYLVLEEEWLEFIGRAAA